MAKKKTKAKYEFDEVDKKHLQDAADSLQRVYFNLTQKSLTETKEEILIFELKARLENLAHPNRR